MRRTLAASAALANADLFKNTPWKSSLTRRHHRDAHRATAPHCAAFHYAAQLSVLRLPAGSGNRNVRQRRIRFRAVPVALAGLDLHHVADSDLPLAAFVGDDAAAVCYH